MNHSQPSTSPFPAPENMDASYMNNGLLSDIESSDKISDLSNETSYHNVNDSPIQGFGSVGSGSMSNSNHTCCSTYRDRENLKKGNQYYIIFYFFLFFRYYVHHGFCFRTPPYNGGVKRTDILLEEKCKTSGLGDEPCE